MHGSGNNWTDRWVGQPARPGSPTGLVSLLGRADQVGYPLFFRDRNKKSGRTKPDFFKVFFSPILEPRVVSSRQTGDLFRAQPRFTSSLNKKVGNALVMCGNRREKWPKGHFLSFSSSWEERKRPKFKFLALIDNANFLLSLTLLGKA